MRARTELPVRLVVETEDGRFRTQEAGYLLIDDEGRATWSARATTALRQSWGTLATLAEWESCAD
jgi:hypothetical protein